MQTSHFFVLFVKKSLIKLTKKYSSLLANIVALNCKSPIIWITHMLVKYNYTFLLSLISCPFLLGWYSETEFHIDMDRNFVCLCCRHNCRRQVIDLSLFWADLLIYDINYWVFKNSNWPTLLSTLLTINLHWVKKINFAVLEEIFNNVGQQF